MIENAVLEDVTIFLLRAIEYSITYRFNCCLSVEIEIEQANQHGVRHCKVLLQRFALEGCKNYMFFRLITSNGNDSFEISIVIDAAVGALIWPPVYVGCMYVILQDFEVLFVSVNCDLSSVIKDKWLGLLKRSVYFDLPSAPYVSGLSVFDIDR